MRNRKGAGLKKKKCHQKAQQGHQGEPTEIEKRKKKTNKKKQ